MRELVFLLSADADIQEAYEYYEDYQEGRGALFISHLDVAFTHLRTSRRLLLSFTVGIGDCSSHAFRMGYFTRSNPVES
jgi:hypothetical protein